MSELKWTFYGPGVAEINLDTQLRAGTVGELVRLLDGWDLHKMTFTGLSGWSSEDTCIQRPMTPDEQIEYDNQRARDKKMAKEERRKQYEQLKQEFDSE